MHQYLWLYRKLHIKKKNQPNTSKLHSPLTESWQVATTDIYSATALTHPFCPPKSENKAFRQTCWPAWKWVWATVCFICVAGLVPWQGIKENNTWQGRRASHCSEKKSVLTTTALPAPLLLLPLSLRRNQLPLYHLPVWCWLYWGHRTILATFNSLFLPFLPPLYKTRWYLHSILRKKLDLL